MVSEAGSPINAAVVTALDSAISCLEVTHLTIQQVIREVAVACRAAVRVLARQLGGAALFLRDWRWEVVWSRHCDDGTRDLDESSSTF